MKFINANNENLQYTGRIDFENKMAPTFIYAGSMVKTKFTGTSIKVVIKNYHNCYDNYLGFLIDDNIDKVKITEHNKEITLTLAEGLEDKVHDLVIYKRQDAAHYFDFIGIIIDDEGEILKPAPKSGRRIECFGDSVSAGEVCEAIDYLGKEDPENHNGKYSNAWYSYSMITARNLNAEINNNAQGGLAVLDKTGFFRGDDYLGLESTYDKLRYNPELGYCNLWDFSKFTPDLVIMALGQNDSHPNDYINEDLDKRRQWKNRYKEIIIDLRNKYPDATFIVITTILCHNAGWDNALDEMVEEIAYNKVLRYKFKRNGMATPGHPRILEEYEMAHELTNFINGLGDKIWSEI